MGSHAPGSSGTAELDGEGDQRDGVKYLDSGVFGNLVPVLQEQLTKFDN